jgi:hypothetical protein
MPCEEYLQKMLVFYEITLNTFISNVVVQVIERHLVYPLIEIFNGSRISTLDAEKVRKIAEEDEATRLKRKKLRNEKERLDKSVHRARDLCARKDLRKFVDSDTFHVPNSNGTPPEGLFSRGPTTPKPRPTPTPNEQARPAANITQGGYLFPFPPMGSQQLPKMPASGVPPPFPFPPQFGNNSFQMPFQPPPQTNHSG